MSSSNFDKIGNNIDILIYIYKMLNWNDQLRLSYVNVELRRIFENYIAKGTFKTLFLHEVNPSSFVITNHTGVNRICLSIETSMEFIKNYGDNVKNLTIKSSGDINWTCFKKLEKLQCDLQKLTVNGLESMAINLLHLEYFSLLYSEYMLDDEDFVKILLKIQTLKHLQLRTRRHIYYSHFRRLLTELKLESFESPSMILPETSDLEAAVEMPIYLKKLRTDASFEPVKWSVGNYKHHLSSFEHLTSLNIKVPHRVTDEILSTLAQACENLKILKLSTDSTITEFFCLPSKLTDLTLCINFGLTMNNLRQILNKTGLKKFISRATRYRGQHEDFPISSDIESLRVDYIDFQRFKSFYAGNHNLKHLTWNNAAPVYVGSRKTFTGDHLETCTNLESLEMYGQIASHKLLQLKNLRKLIMPMLKIPHQWTYILDLLNHSSLKELIIFNCFDVPNQTLEEPAPLEEVSTDIRRLVLAVEIFEMAFEFWLNLFKCNKHLEVECTSIPQYKIDFLKKLIYHEMFPKSVTKIDIFGFATGTYRVVRNFR